MAHSKKATIQLGLVNIPVRLEVAVDDESSGTHTLCTDGGQHEPTRVKMHVDCPTCGASCSSVFGYPERGVERDGKLVVLTKEEIKAAAGEPIKTLTLAFSPREKVYAATVAGDSVQNIYPDKGGERAYAALLEALKATPDRVGTAVWAPSTRNALWVVEVVEGRLVASKRAWPEDVRPTMSIPAADVTAAEQAMLAQVIDAFTEDFDLEKYRDHARQGMRDLVTSRLGDALAIPAEAGTPVVGNGDMLAALQATLAATQPKRSARKAPAKKAAAKRAPAKKAASRRTEVA